MATQAPAMATDKISYADLYARWEKGNWSATALDFTQDRHDWHETFTELERKAALWNYSMFFHGEDSVTDNLSPYIDAAPREEQKYFLATQQVDEARHSVFFARFMKEVVGRGDDIGSSLAATREETTWGFRRTFEFLDVVADRLRRDKSRPSFAAAICMYHIVVEATLAQAGQHFIEGYLEERGILPGFLEGMQHVSKDEQRHIGFGVKCLSDLVKEDPDCRYAVADLLREVLPLTVGVFKPPNWDRRYTEVFGKTIEDLYVDGMRSLEQKLRAAGMPLDELPGPPPLPLNKDPRQAAEDAIKMMQANIIGEKDGPPATDAESMGLLFDAIANSVDHSAANGGMAIQWNFKDADPWYVRIDNGSTEARQGRLEAPDVTLKCRFEDWVDITSGRQDPRLAVLKGRLRPRGRIASLWRMQKVFPSR
ncbi:MAG: ribonucleotide-diphosphate reductase subunit beta [Gaiellaceae bacterium]